MKATFFIRIGLLAACCLTGTLKAQNLYVLDNGGRVNQYSPSGTLVSGFALPFGSELAIAVSGSDIFIAYVNGANTGTVAEYTTSGTLVNSSLISFTGVPGGLAVSGNNIFVVNYGSDSIGEYTTSGATVNASLITGLDHPQGIAISGNDIFVENGHGGLGNSDSVGEYTTSGTTVNATLITGLNLPISSTDAPGYSGIAISGNDLFVANTVANVIGEYTTSGATVNASLISISTPTGLAISGNDLYAVTAQIVDKFTTSGSLVGQFPNQPGFIAGIAIDSVPEPSMVGLLLAGAAAGLARCRRKV